MKKLYVWIYTGEGKESKRHELLDVDIATADMKCKNIITGEIKIFERSKLDIFANINPGLRF